MIDDIPDFFLRPLWNLFLALMRALWFVIWELGVEGLGWWIGWPILRLITAGRFPKQGFAEQDDAPWRIALGVELLGLTILATAIAVVAYWV